ncbi:MAG: PilZ domain-containing protein [Candidatus Aureabacteria bacterium]|nr:PilZ domain-containing protein [Candidatus Auribacterota bacterium]
MQENINENFNEKRACPRYRVKYNATVSVNTRKVGTTIVDISEMGVGLMLSEKVNRGDMLDVNIDAGNEKCPKNINLKAMVAWTGDQNQEGFVKVGLEIIKISVENYEILTKHIQELSQKDEE